MGGRPPGQTFRSAFKAALAEIDPKSKKTYLEVWAKEIRDNAITNQERLEAIKFLEGATPLIKPSDEPLESPDAKDEHGNSVDP